MAIEMQERADGKVLVVHVSGKLTTEDYEQFLPEVEMLIDQHNKIRVLFDMHHFHGWTAATLWQDIKFGIQHLREIERVAMVGDRAWEHAMAVFCRPFTTSTIRYFDRSDIEQAEAWIQADLPVDRSQRFIHREK